MNLPVFTLFQSGKKGDPSQVDLSRRLVANIKAGRIGFLNKYFDELDGNTLRMISEFIPKDTTLVPLPKSAPMVDGAQWPPKEICKFLISHGYGNNAINLLKRIKAVPKAAFQINAEDRPSVEKHYNSIKFDKSEIHVTSISKIVLVDDIVTQGRTAYSCYKRIIEEMPNAQISLFCLVRTKTFEELKKCCEAKLSEIIYYPSGKTFHQDTEDNSYTGFLFE
jgi:predicted amidophosphoribosyltransferase